MEKIFFYIKNTINFGPMKLSNQTIILEDEQLTVVADILVSTDVPASAHPDDPCPGTETTYEVLSIKSVHVCVLDKEDIDITSSFVLPSLLKKRLIDRLEEQLSEDGI